MRSEPHTTRRTLVTPARLFILCLLALFTSCAHQSSSWTAQSNLQIDEYPTDRLQRFAGDPYTVKMRESEGRCWKEGSVCFSFEAPR